MADADRADSRQDAARQRLEILDALIAAFDRRGEVLDVIDASESVEVARDLVSELLGVSVMSATAVLDLQVRRFTKLERRRIVEEREHIRQLTP